MRTLISLNHLYFASLPGCVHKTQNNTNFMKRIVPYKIKENSFRSKKDIINYYTHCCKNPIDITLLVIHFTDNFTHFTDNFTQYYTRTF